MFVWNTSRSSLFSVSVGHLHHPTLPWTGLTLVHSWSLITLHSGSTECWIVPVTSKQSIQGVMTADVLSSSPQPSRQGGATPGLRNLQSGEIYLMLLFFFFTSPGVFCAYLPLLSLQIILWHIWENSYWGHFCDEQTEAPRVSVLLGHPKVHTAFCSWSMVLLIFILTCVSEHPLCAKHSTSSSGYRMKLRERQTFPHRGLYSYRRDTSRHGNYTGGKRRKQQKPLEEEEHIHPLNQCPNSFFSLKKL